MSGTPASMSSWSSTSRKQQRDMQVSGPTRRQRLDLKLPLERLHLFDRESGDALAWSAVVAARG